MCTSMSPESRIVLEPIPGPVISDDSRDRREPPRTNWVAFSARANVSSAAGMSSPTTW